MRPAPSAWRPLVGALALAVLTSWTGNLLDRAVSSGRDLVPPGACAGLPEWLAVHMARAFPDHPLATLLEPAAWPVLVIALAMLTRVLVDVSGSWRLAGVILVALIAATAAPHGLEPLPGLAFAVIAGTAFALHSMDTARPYTVWLAIGGVAATAAVVPTASIPLALLAALLMTVGKQRRGATLRITAGGVVLAAGALVGFGAPSLPLVTPRSTACVLPGGWSLGPVLDLVTMTARASGPYVCALAIFGVATRALAPRIERWRGLATFLVVLVVLAGLGPWEARRFAPAATMCIWLAAAAGLAELVRSCRRQWPGRIAATLLVLLVPALPLSSRFHQSVTRARDFGHARLGLAQLDALLARAPAGSLLVTEDSMVDVLLRARARVDANPAVVTREAIRAGLPSQLSGRPLVALPVAQDSLQPYGWRVRDLNGAPGLALIEPAGQCSVLHTTWRPLPDLHDGEAFALAGASERDQGPLVLYAAFASAPAVHARDWPTAALRGFYVTSYHLADAGEREAFESVAHDDDAPLSLLAADDNAYVVRFEEWRIPGAPLVLTTAMAPGPVHAIGRVLPGDPPDRSRHLTVCRAFTHDILPIGAPN